MSTDTSDLLRSNFPSMLSAESRYLAMAPAERPAMEAGQHVGARMPIELAAERIEQ